MTKIEIEKSLERIEMFRKKIEQKLDDVKSMMGNYQKEVNALIEKLK